MKVSDFLKMVEESPEIKDYNLCLSQFFSIDDEEGVTAVIDCPIVAILTNDQSQEVRFALQSTDIECIKNAPDRILKTLDEG